MLAELRCSPLPIFALDPADYEMGACRALMARVREVTQNGTMFAVLDRLPMDEMTREESFKLFWLISGLLARPVAQKFNGQLYFDVNDTGAVMKPGSGIRPTVTNLDLRFHNGHPSNESLPEHVRLLRQQTAKQGGVSQVVSAFWCTTRCCSTIPISCRVSTGRSGTTATPSMRPASRRPSRRRCSNTTARSRRAWRRARSTAAMNSVRSAWTTRRSQRSKPSATLLDRPELRVELDFKPGQIQYVNNRATGHAHRIHRLARARAQTPPRPPLAAQHRQARVSGLISLYCHPRA